MTALLDRPPKVAAVCSHGWSAVEPVEVGPRQRSCPEGAEEAASVEDVLLLELNLVGAEQLEQF